MGIVTGLATFFLIWWIVIFTILPMNIEREDKVEVGHDRGAPKRPDLKKKLLLNTLVTIVLWCLIFVLVELGIFDFRKAFAENAEPLTPNFQKLCDRLVEYQQPGGVEFQPGVDAHGHIIVPADVNQGGALIETPQELSFPLTIDIAEQLNIDFPAGIEANTVVGNITFKENKPYYNGQPLTHSQTEGLTTLCNQ